ncbi:hypothetical protein WDW86_14080 [Bdellovibrionota bacterium FG-2]
MKNIFFVGLFLASHFVYAIEPPVNVNLDDKDIVRCSPDGIYDAGYSFRATAAEAPTGMNSPRLVGTVREVTFAGGKEIATYDLATTAERSLDGTQCKMTLKPVKAQDGRAFALTMSSKISEVGYLADNRVLEGRINLKNNGVETPQELGKMKCFVSKQYLSQFQNCMAPTGHPNELGAGKPGVNRATVPTKNEPSIFAPGKSTESKPAITAQ